MDLCKTADFGLSSMGYTNTPNQIGFIPPTNTYDKMRQIQSFAQSLDLNVQTYVADPVFKASWNAWYEGSWKPYFDKHAGPDARATNKILNAFYSEELAQQVESYRQQLTSFEANYSKQRTYSGQTVPELPGAGPNKITPPQQQGSFVSNVPWWIWALGGLALIGTGYLISQRLNTPRRRILKYFQHDQSLSTSRDLPLSPMTLSDYAEIADQE